MTNRNKKIAVWSTIIALGVGLAFFWTTSTPQIDALPQTTATAVKSYVSTQESATTNEITILSVEKVDWPDSCLGVANTNEMCARVITPGYRIRVNVRGEERIYHTNESGTAIRIAQ